VVRAFPLLLVLFACASSRPPGPRPDPVPLAAPVALTVVTFNVHDLFVADRRLDRMRAIGRALGAIRPDVVALQEAFSTSHRDAFLGELRRVSGLPYEGHYFPSGWMGSGLTIASRHPIEDAGFRRYTRNGRWFHFARGDWYAGKGVALARVRLPAGALDLYDTHAVAGYASPDDYLEDRKAQMRELNAFVAETRRPGVPALVLGDLNCGPGEPDYLLATGAEGIPLRRLLPDDTWTIDHVLVAEDPHLRVDVQEVSTVSEAPDDEGRPLLLSDHPGWVVRLRIAPTGSAR